MKELLVIWMGGHALLGQVLLLRELLVVLSGHEVCLGILFGSWLGGIFAGGLLGGRLPGLSRHPLGAFVGFQTAAVLLAPLLVVSIRHLRGWMYTPPGVPLPLIPTMLAALLLVAPLSTLVGLLFPTACRMLAAAGEPARAAGRVYVLEAVGSLLAGVLLTYVLLPKMDSMSILATGGMVVLLTATLVVGHEALRAAIPVGLVTILWGLALSLGGFQALQRASIEARWEAIHPGIERLATADSRYQSVELGRLDEQVSVFGNGHMLATFPDPQAAAPAAHIVMNQRPQPRDLLIVGGGPGSLLPLVLSYPVRNVLQMELDPRVFQMAEPFLPTEEREAARDPRVTLSFVDGRYGLKHLPPQSLDAVFVRVPDPATALLNRYHTVEFFRDIKRALRPQGILAHSVTGSVNYIGTEVGGYVGSVYQALRESFPEVLLAPGDQILLLACATPGTLTLDSRKLGDRLRENPTVAIRFPPEVFAFWIQEEQIQLWQRALEACESPINSDSQPVAYLHYLSLWDLISGGKSGHSPFRYLEELPFAGVLALCLCVILAAMVGRGGIDLRRAPMLVIGVTGFTGMAQEILCLYMYQTLQGYLYSRLGMIVALFMGGLALGGWVGSRYRSGDPARTLRVLLIVQGFLVFLCAGIPLGWVPTFFGAGRTFVAEGLLEGAVGLWMALAGFGTGAAFPLVCQLRSQRDLSVGRVAGAVNAIDHLGAALGALVPGVLLVPAFGLARTGTLLAIMQASALGMIILSLRKTSSPCQ